jgi:antitoxin (DNA-binding transcriptional repressor) of toxin-antitoxin stability system
MNMVRIADLKNNLSRHLARVRRGSELTVYDRETTVARIVPFVPSEGTARSRSASEQAASADRIAELVREGVLSTGDPHALADWTREHQPVRRPAGSPSGVDLLLTMRRESRR